MCFEVFLHSLLGVLHGVIYGVCSIFQGFVQKARKAKNRLLKREGDDRAESGSQGYESFSYGGVDPYMWEPQELGKKFSSFIQQMFIEHLYVLNTVLGVGRGARSKPEWIKLLMDLMS